MTHTKPFLLLFISFLSCQTFAQTKISYNIFDKPSLGQLLNKSLTLQPFTFEPVGINNYTQPKSPNSNFGQSLSPFDNNKQNIQQNNLGLQQYERDVQSSKLKEQQLAEVKRDMAEEESYKNYLTWLNESKSYRQAFSELSKLNADSFSISKAVFTVENAYFDNTLSYNYLIESIKARALLVKQILKREGLSSKNNLALNYGIQKLFSQQNLYVIPKTSKGIFVPPFKYDFDDFRGEKDYRKMFVWKELQTGKGQCHSMPLLYLMIAEELGAKAKLSLAPQHSFIKFQDKEGRMMNFETTNGNLVSNTWMIQSGYITAKALEQKTYLDTLSSRQLYAQMYSDLLLGYLSKFPYDNFAEAIQRKILSLNPSNSAALITDAGFKQYIAMQMINAVGRPKPEDLPKFPAAYQAYLRMTEAFQKVDDIGYQDMPKEAYQKWLKSIDVEKKKQSEREVKEKMQREIQQLKNIKSTLKQSPMKN